MGQLLSASPWSETPELKAPVLIDVPDLLAKMAEINAGTRPVSDLTTETVEEAILQSREDGDSLREFARLMDLHLSAAEDHLQHCPDCSKKGQCVLELMAKAMVEVLPPPAPVSASDSWETKIAALSAIQRDQRTRSDVSNETFESIVKEAVAEYDARGIDTKLQQLANALQISRSAAETALAGHGREMSKSIYRPIFQAVLRRPE